MAVRPMRAGAIDFLEKPFREGDLLACVERALDLSSDKDNFTQRRLAAQAKIATLTQRQREVLDHVLAGHGSKHIAKILSLSQRTIDNHRAAIMKKIGAQSLCGCFAWPSPPPSNKRTLPSIILSNKIFHS